MSATSNKRRRRSRRSPYAPVGSTVLCGYWREEYTVLSHNDDGTVTVRWHGRTDYVGDTNHPSGRLGTHRTPFDPRVDRIVRVAPTQTIASPDPSIATRPNTIEVPTSC
jgi:hypothetical protein